MPILKGKFFFHQISKEKSAAYYIQAGAIVGQIGYTQYTISQYGKENHPKSAAIGCFLGIQERIRNNHGKQAISALATEVLL